MTTPLTQQLKEIIELCEKKGVQAIDVKQADFQVAFRLNPPEDQSKAPQFVPPPKGKTPDEAMEELMFAASYDH